MDIEIRGAEDIEVGEVEPVKCTDFWPPPDGAEPAPAG